MMTRTEYMAMANNALQHYERLIDSLPRDAHIVFVLSREVYLAMLREEYQFDVRLTGTQALYHGVPICCINEDDAGEFFMPVVHSRNFHHYEGVQVNDFVLFNDENNDYLYKLVRLTPDAMYVDTGLTVTFLETPPRATVWAEAVEGALAEAAMAADAMPNIDMAAALQEAATADADTLAYNPEANAITYAGIPVEDYAGIADVAAVDDVTQWLRDNGTELVGTIDRAITREELDRIADAWNNTPAEPLTFAADRINTDPFVARINEEVLEQLAGWRPQYMAQWVTEPAQTERPVRAKRKTVVKEKELNPGDTKLIDEYLNSFLRSGV